MKLSAPFRQAGEHIAIDLAPGTHAIFTTRRGGCSRGAYASLNLGVLTGDDRQAVLANRGVLAAELGVTLTFGRQVHGAHVAIARIGGDHSNLLEADGHATAVPGIAPLVFTADCVPVALAHEGAVAMLHAGWRGLAGGVIAEGVRVLRALGNGGPIHAAIGPGAGPCCYEAGEEVHAALADAGAAARRGRNADLKAVAAHQLRRAGVRRVEDVGLCTICEPELFFSHRRDHGVTGRQAGVAWLS